MVESSMIARALENPVGTVYYLDLALWAVEEFTCLPLAQITGSQCSLSDDIDPGGSPSDILHCEPGPVALPDHSGDFNRCEIDFFVGYLGVDGGVGFGIAASEQRVGGLGAQDDYGVNVFFLEDFPGAGTWSASWFGDDTNMPADFENLTVCTDNLGACCEDLGTCYDVPESQCTGEWTPCLFWEPYTGCDDPDGDGLPSVCGDNCPAHWNPGQEDCDEGFTPEGDVCETDGGYTDPDEDGVCTEWDPCPYHPYANKNVCGDCGVPILDPDGDGLPYCFDACPLNPDKGELGVCGCECTVQNGCMCGFDVECDTDGDGVVDCVDECPGVDDAVFAPGCQGPIPTVSQWGVIILTLLLLVAGKVYFGRRPAFVVTHKG